ncbi:MAG: YbjP/YqhG family protein [Pyrinomonadaceae bacterium]|nr:YbjP/YqhG family protein [Pyrinomonadaceae bacterium]
MVSIRRVVTGAMVLSLLALVSASAVRGQTSAVLRSPAGVVRDLYRVHNNGRGHLFEARGKANLYKFFDKQLADLIWKDIHETPEGEVGNLGFDPLYNAQDMEITQFQIGPPVLASDHATVVVSFKNFGQLTKIEFRMVKRKQAWKISNVDYGDDSDLIKILSPPK